MIREQNARLALKLLKGMAQKAGCSPGDAEEVAAQVLEKCCRKASAKDAKFRWECPHWGYLKGILRRTVLAFRRRERRHLSRSWDEVPELAPNNSGIEPVDNREPSPEQRLMDRECADLVEQALDALSHRDRLLLYEHYWQGRQLIDVAHDNGESPGAVRNRKSRAEKRLQPTLRRAV